MSDEEKKCEACGQVLPKAEASAEGSEGTPAETPAA